MFKLCFSSLNLIFPVLRDVGTFLGSFIKSLVLMRYLTTPVGPQRIPGSHSCARAATNDGVIHGRNCKIHVYPFHTNRIHMQLNLFLVSSGHLGSSKCPQLLQRHEGNREKFKSKDNVIKIKYFTSLNFSKI